MSKNGRKTTRKKRVETDKAPPAKSKTNGQFLPGNNCGGRPKMSFEFMAVAREKAKETGEDLKDILWDTFMAVVEQAKGGDVAAAQAIWNRLCGAVDRGPLVAIQNNAAHMAIDTRNAIKAMIERSDVQGVMLDELENMTLEEDR